MSEMPSQPANGAATGRAAATFVVALIGVACAAATFALVFRVALLTWYQHAFGAANVVDAIAGLPWWGRLFVPPAGAFVVGLFVAWQQPDAQSVSNVMEAVALGNVRLSWRTTLSRVARSWIAIASGLSIGREGPLIEFGGTAGAVVGRRLHLPTRHVRILIAAGTAAGFAAAYNTPFAAVLFVLETILGIAALSPLLAVIISTVIATTVTRAMVGAGPIYGARAFASESLANLIAFGVLATTAAGLATVFKGLLAFFEDWMQRAPVPQAIRPLVGGLMVGLIAIGLPEIVGNGYEPINAMLDVRLLAPAAAALIVAKMVATSASVGSGIPGGVFTPTLMLGAALGVVCQRLAALMLGAHAAGPGSYALVGMAAMTAASVHAPLTAAVLVFELSGDYAVVVPLLLATAVATAVSKRLGSESVYDAELHRRGVQWDLTLDGRRILGRRP
jgi:chloride channel protein, CIC family